MPAAAQFVVGILILDFAFVLRAPGAPCFADHVAILRIIATHSSM
jgi:hypothetical protein